MLSCVFIVAHLLKAHALPKHITYYLLPITYYLYNVESKNVGSKKGTVFDTSYILLPNTVPFYLYTNA